MKKLLVASMSGGLDSATLVRKALGEGYIILPVNFQYGQKNYIESVAQSNLIEFFGKKFPDQILKTVSIDTTRIISDFIVQYQSARDSGLVLEKTGEEFYTPSRNLLFMTLCAVIGEITAIGSGYEEISIGLGIHKHSTENYKKDYWDITPEFARRLQNLLVLNDSVEINIYSPYVDEYKSGIIQDAEDMNLPFSLTWSCYDPVLENIEEGFSSKKQVFKPCNVCEACLERDSQARKIGIYGINDYFIETKIEN